MENDKLLLEGQTYLFATRYLKEENWPLLIPVGGDIPFNSEEGKEELSEKYNKAYKEVIPFNGISFKGTVLFSLSVHCKTRSFCVSSFS
jgi:hypothetical protein